MSVKSRGSRTLERSRVCRLVSYNATLAYWMVSDDVNAKICETILEAVKFVVAQDSRGRITIQYSPNRRRYHHKLRGRAACFSRPWKGRRHRRPLYLCRNFQEEPLSRSWNCRCPQTRHPSQQSVTRPHLPVYGGQSRSCLPTRFSDEYGEQYGGRSQRELLINWSGSSIGNRWTTVQRCCCRKCRHSITSEHYAVP
ncbi:hypothetical protein Y032_0034g2928 [Ancylostoma ceylanicum]|uniref:Uncharacterized protein n=1 Tax=Ancylostoma ceylanicum TaxID=53326 RepID=A0A016UM96_9BILA|nr:hypothetical protein Y032_0034g2928 [Ancylostoma ceylanicum]